MVYGNKPTDGGYLFLTPEEREMFLSAEPENEKWVRQILGAIEYLNDKERYCLWLVGITQMGLRKSKFIMERVEGVHSFRLSSTKDAT